jgi:hypothetical protein
VALPLYTGSASMHGLADLQRPKLGGKLRSCSFKFFILSQNHSKLKI